MISVVISTKNEEATIGEVVDAVKPYYNEVIVVDGHSTDKTREVCSDHGVEFVLDSGKGKGTGGDLAFRVVDQNQMKISDEFYPRLLKDKPFIIVYSIIMAGMFVVILK